MDGSLRRLVLQTSARASMVPCGVGLSQGRRFPFHHARAPMRIAQHTLAFRVLGLRRRTTCFGITFTWPFPLRLSCPCIVVIRYSSAWIHVRPPSFRQRTRRMRRPSVRFHSSFESALRLLRHPPPTASATCSLTWCCSDVLPSPTQVRRIRSPLDLVPSGSYFLEAMPISLHHCSSLVDLCHFFSTDAVLSPSLPVPSISVKFSLSLHLPPPPSLRISLVLCTFRYSLPLHVVPPTKQRPDWTCITPTFADRASYRFATTSPSRIQALRCARTSPFRECCSMPKEVESKRWRWTQGEP